MPRRDWDWLKRLRDAQDEYKTKQSLSSVVRRVLKKADGTERRVAPHAWCIVFRLGSPTDPTALSEEAAEIIERMVRADLDVETILSTCGTELYVTLGASEEVLIDEAGWHMAEHPIRVKLKGTEYTEHVPRGTVPFSRAIIDHMKPTATGFVFHSGQRQLIIKHRYERLTRIIFEVRMLLRPRHQLLQKAASKLSGGKKLQVRRLGKQHRR